MSADVTYITPIVPGYLLRAELAQAAGIKPSTLDKYTNNNAAGAPKADSRSGDHPMWSLDLAASWINNRRYARTRVEVTGDGRVKVTRPTA